MNILKIILYGVSVILMSSCSIVRHMALEEEIVVTPDFVNGKCVLDQSHFKSPNTNYILRDKCVLNGAKIFIPSNCMITFIDDGSIDCGMISGMDTYIKAPEKQIFGSDVDLKGSFKADPARPIWFGINPDCILGEDGIFLQGTNWTERFVSLLLFDDIQLDYKGCYYINGHLTLRSDQRLDGNGSTLKWVYTKHKPLLEIGYVNGYKYVENVQLKDLRIVGNKMETDDVTEYCHGISIGYASDISLSDIEVAYCRGDGLYVGTNVSTTLDNITPNKISVKNFKAISNHRQGMSITRVNGLVVEDSEFSYTSGTAPSAGIDIEPNMLKGDDGELYITECLNISISNCRFIGNEGYGLVMGHSSCNQSNVQEVISDIIVSKCTFVSNRLYVYGGKNIMFNDIDISDSKLEIRAPGYTDNIVFKNMKITCDVKNNDMSAISFVLYSVDNANTRINNITFNNIDIIGFGAYGIYIPKVVSRDKEIPYLSGLTICRVNIYDCVVPIYVAPDINEKRIKLNKYRAIAKEELTPTQLQVRESAPDGCYINGESFN